MKINFEMLDNPIPIEFPTLLMVEEIKLFKNIVEELYEYSEDSVIKIYDKKHVNIKAKEIVLVTDIMGYEINSRPLINSVRKSVVEQLNEEPQRKMQLEQLLQQLLIELDDVLIDSELDLIAYEASIEDLMKMFNVSVDVQPHSINERFYDIVQVVKYLKNKKLLIFINSLSYLTNDERMRLFEFISCCEVYTLFIEPRKIVGCKQFIIDSDYFVYQILN